MALTNVLITGAGGFIGKNLLAMIDKAKLGDEYRFTTVSSRPVDGWNTIIDPRSAAGWYTFTQEDIRCAGIEDLHAIIHLGAFTPKSGAEADDIGASTTNIVNTQHLINTTPKPRNFIFASTLDVYGSQDGPLHEDVIPRPATLYGAGKLYCEQMLNAWSRHTADAQVNLTILRIGHIYGPGEELYRKFIPQTIARLKSGQAPLVSTTGTEKRSFLYIEDCCRMIMRVLQEDCPADCLNLASSNITTIGQVADMLTRIAKDQGQSVVNGPRGQRMGSDMIVDVSRIRQLYPIDEVSLMDGLRTQYSTFRDDR
jgi:UDP-glucose 4-epimerase